MVRALYRFYLHYHVRRVLKRLQVPLPYESEFNIANTPYSSKGLFKLCEDYKVPHNPMSYRNEKFFGTDRHEGWSDYIGPDSMTCWIIEKSQGSINVGLLRISGSVILSSQDSARSCIISNTVSALTVQKAFLNNFENVMNWRADIQEDIKWYQNTLSYASGKVDYNMGLSIYMLPSDMNLNIGSGTVRYNKILSV